MPSIFNPLWVCLARNVAIILIVVLKLNCQLLVKNVNFLYGVTVATDDAELADIAERAEFL